MFKQKQNFLVAAAVAAAVSGAAFANAQPSQEVIDARQESQIWTTYALSPYLRANDLQVSVHEGKATLTGKVPESVNKDLAKQIALGVKGIKSVDNNIEVVANYKSPAPSADRSYGEVVDDASITSAVQSKLQWSRYADGLTAEMPLNISKRLFAASTAPNTPETRVKATPNAHSRTVICAA